MSMKKSLAFENRLTLLLGPWQLSDSFTQLSGTKASQPGRRTAIHTQDSVVLYACHFPLQSLHLSFPLQETECSAVYSSQKGREYKRQH